MFSILKLKQQGMASVINSNRYLCPFDLEARGFYLLCARIFVLIAADVNAFLVLSMNKEYLSHTLWLTNILPLKPMSFFVI